MLVGNIYTRFYFCIKKIAFVELLYELIYRIRVTRVSSVGTENKSLLLSLISWMHQIDIENGFLKPFVL